MKIFLDNIREAPDNSWTTVRSANKAIGLLKQSKVSIISLDHDLGNDKPTGYAVLLWIERHVHKKGFKSPIIKSYSMNPMVRKRIGKGIESLSM